MSDDKKVIFSMVKVNKTTPQGKQILKDIYLSFFYGAKIGILGLNGAGKSTVMKIIAGLDEAYQGEVVWAPGYSLGYLPQEPELDESKTVKEVVMEGVKEITDVLAEYEDINNKFMDEEIMNDPDKMQKLIDRQAEVQDRIEVLGAWELDTKLEIAMDALRTPEGDTPMKTFRVESEEGLHCVDFFYKNLMFYCSMSLPTTSMLNLCSGWSSTYSSTKEPYLP